MLNITLLDFEFKFFIYFQVLVDGANSPAYATINVGEGATEMAVAKDIAFDSSKQHMYALTGNRVSTFRLSIYVIESGTQ